MTQFLTGNVAITKYTPYTDDLNADDAFITLSPGATMVLTGHDLFEDDTIAGQGIWRIRGPLFADQVRLEQHVFTANNSTVTQTGFVSTGRAGTNDLTVIRNLPSAVWDITADVNIGPSADFSRFVNLGLFEKTGGTGTSVVASIMNSVGDVEVSSGELQFTGLRARFTGSVGGAGTIDVTTRAVLDGVDVSVAQFTAGLAIIHNTVKISGAYAFDTVVLQNGRLELTGDGSTLPATIKGTGTVVVEGQAKLAQLNLYQHVEIDNAGSITARQDGPAEVGYDIHRPASGSASTFDNLAGATFTWALNALTDDQRQRIENGLSSAYSAATVGIRNSTTFSNQGLVDVAQGWSQTNLQVDNDGVYNVGQAGTGPLTTMQVFAAQVTGRGTINIEDGATVVFASGASAQQTVDFVASGANSGATLSLGIVDLADFHAVIAGFATGSATETISIKNATFESFDVANGSGRADGILFENNGFQASLTFSAPIDTSLLHVHAGSGGTGTVITYS